MKKKDKNIKKKYQPPQVETKEIYEVNALGCAKCPSAQAISLSASCIRGVKKFS